MKKLKEFEPVKQALIRVATEASIAFDNGTYGKELFCQYWNKEEVYDKERNDKEIEIARSILTGKADLVPGLKAELAAMPKPKINMIFRLMEPMKRLVGSKIAHDGGKVYSPIMEDIRDIYIPEDALDMDLVEFEDTEHKAVDEHGNETPVIKLKLVNAMLDVKEGKVDWKDETKEIRAPRVYVTAISYRSMQVAGKIMNNEGIKRRGMYGFNEI